MATTEVLGQVASRMLKGIMIHSQLADYYGFLGLKGYQRCHTYRYFDESKSYRNISDYCLSHCNKIITEPSFDNPKIIPADWGQYYRQQVTPEIRKNSIKIGFDKWVDWEVETKKTYEQYYMSLLNSNEIATAIEIQKLIEDVTYELTIAVQDKLELEAIDYDITTIIQEQDSIYKKYNKMLKDVELC